jgi:molybdenum cofactor biosynthesis enzyme MoaA
MEELMKNFMIAIALIFVITFTAEAARPRYYSQSNTVVQSYTSNYTSSSDQDRCQAEANYMAANNISGHVWGTIGSFEGVGYGSSPNCNTCTPSNNMRLTGDAAAQGNNGKWYRVRSWR